MRNQIKITGVIGIIAAILMFLGDMFLYFTTENISNFEEEIIAILGEVSNVRLLIGGLLGPLASFLFIIGFYQIYLAIKPAYTKIAKLLLALLSLGIIYGGAFHSHFTHLGIMSFANNTEALKLAENYSVLTFYFMFFPSLIAYIILAYLILAKKTYYPKWVVLVSPIILFWFSEVVQLLPQPYLIVIAGGWSNIIFILFFSVSTFVLLKNNELGSG